MTVTPRLGGPAAWANWIVGTLFVVLLFDFQTGYAIVNSDLARDTGLGLGDVVALGAIYTWVFAVSQLFSGALLDRAGARIMLPLAIGCFALGAALFAMADSFAMLAWAQAVVAIGSSFGFVGAGFLGGRWFGFARFGLMFAMAPASAARGATLGQAGRQAARAHVDWRGMSWWAAGAGAALTLVALAVVRDPQPQARSSGGVAGFVTGVLHDILSVCRIPQVWFGVIAGAVLFGLLLALGVLWTPKILAAHGLSGTEAGYATSVLWLGLAVGAPLTARWSDAVHSRRLPMLLMTVLLVLGMAALLFLPLTALSAGVVCFVIGLATGGHMLSFVTAAELVEPRLIGTSAAIANGAKFIAAGLLMALPNRWLASTEPSLADYQLAFWPYFALLVVAALMAWGMQETWRDAE